VPRFFPPFHPELEPMLKNVAIGVVAVLVLVVGLVASRPSDFKVERSATLAAPTEVVFAQVNDFHAWAGWSPWEGLDPAMKKTFSGAANGTGAVYEWDSKNDKAGAGRMTIRKSDYPASIDLELMFLRPFPATNATVFTFAPAGEGATKVTWTMTGTNNFMGKAASMFFDMDKMVGGDFERGLAALGTRAKTDAEARARAKADAAAPAPGPAPEPN
jgi:hypothetical protein